jgi:hypothetical protein
MHTFLTDNESSDESESQEIKLSCQSVSQDHISDSECDKLRKKVKLNSPEANPA